MLFYKSLLPKVAILFFLFNLGRMTSYSQTFKTVGYLPTYRFSTLEKLELNKLTHLNIAFANPDSNGQLQTDGIVITEVVQKAHDVDLEVFIALAGGAAKLSDWEDWIKPVNRSAFISGIIDYVFKHELQGVDVDLEWSNVNEDYSGFVIELRDSLNQYNLQLSAALPGLYRYPEITEEALTVFDWVNLMVYDLTGPWQPNNAGPHSPYSFAENSIDYWLTQGLEKERMTLGMPFYGYDFSNPNDVRAFTFSTIVNMNPVYAEMDQVDKLYYNGLLTIDQKTRLALEELSGVMIWEIGQDAFGEFSLLNRISETIEASLSTTSITTTINQINVYPNPVINSVNLNLNSPQNFSVRLLSTCQKVLSVQSFQQQDFVSIDMNDLTKGMYFLNVEGDDYRRTFKLVKQ